MSRIVRNLVIGVIYVILVLPNVAVVVSSFSASSIIRFPPEGFSFEWYGKAIADQGMMDGLVLSVQLGLIVSIGAAIIGTAAALGIARTSGRFRRFVESLVLAPITVPNIVLGLALLMVFSQLGWLNLRGLIIGHIVITIPFMVRTVMASLTDAEAGVLRAAASLGASPAQAFRHVTLPMIRPGVFAGSMFTFLVSFNNITLSIWINSPGRSTLPVVLFQRLDTVADPSVLAMSALVIIGTLIAVIVLEWRFAIFRALLR